MNIQTMPPSSPFAACMATLRQVWRTHRLWLGLSLGAVGAAYALLVLAQTAPPSPVGSTLVLEGKVVNSPGGTTLGSSSEIASGDTVQWTSLYASRLGVGPAATDYGYPIDAYGTATLPKDSTSNLANFTWVPGSFLAPPNTTPSWVLADGTVVPGTINSSGTTEVSATDKIKQVKWTQLPYTLSAASNGGGGGGTGGAPRSYISGVGNGNRAIRYGDYVYFINSQSDVTSSGDYLRCYNAVALPEENPNCALFNGAGNVQESKSINGNLGQPILDLDADITQTRSVEHLHAASGNLFTYVVNSTGVSVVCVNLTPTSSGELLSCMNRKSMGNADIGSTKSASLHIIGSAGDKYFALGRLSGKLYCFDAGTKSICQGYDNKKIKISNSNTATLGSNVAGGYSAFGEFIDGNRIFFKVSQPAGAVTGDVNKGTFRCWDKSLGADCAGWTYGKYSASDSDYSADLVPILSGSGDLVAICTKNFECYKPDGSVFPSSSLSQQTKAYINSISSPNSTFEAGIAAIPSDYSNRIYGTAEGQVATCWEFTGANGAGANCDGFPLLPSHFSPPLPASSTSIYNIHQDATGCMWATGDGNGTGISYSFMPNGSRPCVATPPSPSPPTTSVTPIDINLAEYFQCDPSQQMNVTRWDRIRFSPNLPWAQISSIKATIKGADGVQIGAVRTIPSNQYSLSISDIPYSANTTSLQITLTITANSGATLPTITDTAVDVTWIGPPAQTCFQAKAPNPLNCDGLVVSKLDMTGKAHHDIAITEVLTTQTQAFQTGSNSTTGYGPTTVATTLREDTSGGGTNTKILQTTFDMLNFKGDMKVYSLTSTITNDVTATTLTPPAAGSAGYASAVSNLVPWNARTAYVGTPPANLGSVNWLNNWSTSILNWEAVDANPNYLKKALRTNLDGTLANDTIVKERIRYLLGDATDEAGGAAGGTRRNRGGNFIAPVLNSSPTYMPKIPQVGYLEANFPQYFEFRKTMETSANRKATAFFGGNDGFLHAYHINNGLLTEAYNYMPYITLKKAARYTDTTAVEYRSRPNFVDNTPMIRDVNLANISTSNRWGTVAIGTLGQGGRGIYAINVTDYTNLDVLWEYDNTMHPDLKDLGYSVGQPPQHDVAGAEQIVRIGRDAKRWAVVVGNGFGSNDSADSTNSGTGRPVLYIFYLNNLGPKWHRIEAYPNTAVDSATINADNGLGNPRPVDTDGDGVVDLIYAGDLKGNLWRFDVSNLDPSPNTTSVTASATRLFTADAGQAIVAAPSARLFGGGTSGTCTNLSRCWMISVGTTGSPLLSPQKPFSSTSRQHLYGLWDNGDSSNPVYTSSNLVTRTLADTTVPTGSGSAGFTYRTFTGPITTIDFSQKRGWKIPLSIVASTNSPVAEHMVANPKIQDNGDLLFSTTRPVDPGSSCSATWKSWATQISPILGAPSNSVFAGGNAASLGYSGATFETPLALRPPEVRSPSQNLIIQFCTGNECLPTDPAKKATSLMLGRASWREVYGAPR